MAHGALGDRIDRGRRLIDTLRADGIDVVGAVWVYEEDHGGWTLRIATPPAPVRDLLRKVWSIIYERGESGLDMQEVRFTSLDAPVIGAARDAPVLAERQLGLGILGRELVEDAYIYRLAA